MSAPREERADVREIADTYVTLSKHALWLLMLCEQRGHAVAKLTRRLEAANDEIDRLRALVERAPEPDSPPVSAVLPVPAVGKGET